MASDGGYDMLRDAIVHGRLAPSSRLVEADLCESFAMTRAAVRTALVRLEQEGLVVREPNRGARVRHVSDQEAVEIIEARAALEGLAAREAARRIDDAGADRLRARLDRHLELLEAGDLLAVSDANADLHAALVDISGHRTAQQLIRALNSQTVRFQFRTILIPGRARASYEEHRAIVDAVIGGSADDAEHAMRAHLFTVAEALRERRGR
jgi:DNA-binding GntR family transcriptional regulator